VQAARQEVVRGGFGIASVERLPGNIGYVDLREFDPVEFVAPAYEAALSLLRGTDALILDLKTLIAANIEPKQRKSLQQLLVQTESKTTMPSSVPPPQ
jgi:hypothetical protein